MKHLELMTAIASHLPEWEVESEQHLLSPPRMP